MMRHQNIIFFIFSVALAGLIFSCALPMLHMNGESDHGCMLLASPFIVSPDRTGFLFTYLLLLAIALIAIYAQRILAKELLPSTVGLPRGHYPHLLDFNFNNPVSGLVLVRTVSRKVF